MYCTYNPFRNEIKLKEGIGLNAWDAIALRTLCIGEVDDGLWSEGKCGLKYETSCVDAEQMRGLRVIS